MTGKTKRKLLIAAGGIVLSGVISYAVNYVLQEHYRRITVGRDTTFVNGPQLADGRMDFLSAVNARLSDGVTPESNAAVPLYLATHPKSFYIGWRLEAYRKALGVVETPKEDEAYVDFATFMFERALEASTQPREVKGREGELREQWNDQEEACRKTPWGREQGPDLDAWLERNQHVLELVREASRRERYFDPMIGRADLGTTMFASIGPVGAVRSYTNLLAVDAMRALGSGDLGRWRADVVAQKRLGRHLMHSGTVIACLVGLAITSAADDTVAGGLPKLAPQDAGAMLAELRSLPPLVDINDCLDQYERLGVIGEICQLAHFGPAASDVNNTDPAEPLPPPRSLGFQPPVYFDDLLREHNALMDRRLAAGRAASYSARKAAFAALDAECLTIKTKATGSSTTAAIRQLILVMVEHGDRTSVLQDRMREHERLTELALALVIYRGEHGSYPKTLAELGEVGAAAKDLFADEAPVRYAAQPAMIYSVGPNQRDDQGVYDRPRDKRPLNVIVSGEASVVVDYPDDMAVKLP